MAVQYDFTIKLDPLNYISEESSFQVLSYLDIKDLVQCSRISQLWYRIAMDNILWKNLFPQIEFPKNVEAISYLRRYFVTTTDQILQQFRKCVNTAQLNQICSFKCLFPFNPENNLEILFGFGTRDIQFILNKICNEKSFVYEPDSMIICIFMKTLVGQSSYLAIESSTKTIGIPENTLEEDNLFTSYIKQYINIKSYSFSKDSKFILVSGKIKNIFEDRRKELIEEASNEFNGS